MTKTIKINKLLDPKYFLHQAIPRELSVSSDEPLVDWPDSEQAEFATWYFKWCQATNKNEIQSQPRALVLLKLRTENSIHGARAKALLAPLYQLLKEHEKDRAVIFEQLHEAWVGSVARANDPLESKVCHGGFLAQVQEARMFFARPSNLQEILTQIRSNLAGDIAKPLMDRYMRRFYAHEPNKGHIETATRYYASVYYGAIPFGEDDVNFRHSFTRKSTILTALSTGFNNEYQLFTIINQCLSKISEQLSQNDYFGSKILDGTTYKDGEYGKFWEIIKKLIEPQAENKFDDSYFKTDENLNLFDINIEKIKYRIFEIFLEGNALKISAVDKKIIIDMLNKSINEHVHVAITPKEFQVLKKLLPAKTSQQEMLNAMQYFGSFLDERSFLRLFGKNILSRLNALGNFSTIDASAAALQQKFIDLVAAISGYEYEYAPRIRREIQSIIRTPKFLMRVLSALPPENRMKLIQLLDNTLFSLLTAVENYGDMLALLPPDAFANLSESYMTNFFATVTTAQNLAVVLKKLNSAQCSALLNKIDSKFSLFIKQNDECRTFFQIIAGLKPSNYSEFVDLLQDNDNNVLTKITLNQNQFFDNLVYLPCEGQRQLIISMTKPIQESLKENKIKFYETLSRLNKKSAFPLIKRLNGSLADFLDKQKNLDYLNDFIKLISSVSREVYKDFKGDLVNDYKEIINFLRSKPNLIKNIIQSAADFISLLNVLDPEYHPWFIRLLWNDIYEKEKNNPIELLRLLNNYPIIVETMISDNEFNFPLNTENLLETYQKNPETVLVHMASLPEKVSQHFIDILIPHDKQTYQAIKDLLNKRSPIAQKGLIKALGHRLTHIILDLDQFNSIETLLPDAAKVDLIRGIGFNLNNFITTHPGFIDLFKKLKQDAVLLVENLSNKISEFTWPSRFAAVNDASSIFYILKELPENKCAAFLMSVGTDKLQGFIAGQGLFGKPKNKKMAERLEEIMALLPEADRSQVLDILPIPFLRKIFSYQHTQLMVDNFSVTRPHLAHTLNLLPVADGKEWMKKIGQNEFHALANANWGVFLHHLRALKEESRLPFLAQLMGDNLNRYFKKEPGVVHPWPVDALDSVMKLLPAIDKPAFIVQIASVLDGYLKPVDLSKLLKLLPSLVELPDGREDLQLLRAKIANVDIPTPEFPYDSQGFSHASFKDRQQELLKVLGPKARQLFPHYIINASANWSVFCARLPTNPTALVQLIEGFGEDFKNFHIIKSHLAKFLPLLPLEHRFSAINQLKGASNLDHAVGNVKSLVSVLRLLPEAERYSFWLNVISSDRRDRMMQHSTHRQLMAIAKFFPTVDRLTFIQSIVGRNFKRLTRNANTFFKYRSLLPQKESMKLVTNVVASAPPAAKKLSCLKKMEEEKRPKSKFKSSFGYSFDKRTTEVREIVALFDRYAHPTLFSRTNHHNKKEAKEIEHRIVRLAAARESENASPPDMRDLLEIINSVTKDVEYNPVGTFAGLIAKVALKVEALDNPAPDQPQPPIVPGV